MIDDIAGRYVSDTTPGFSMLLARGGKVLFRKAYGMADLEHGVPIKPSDHFIIASNTKQFTCLLILMLREKGLLDLDEPIARFFPDFPEYKDTVTIRMLMCHTSGITEYFDEEELEKLIPVLRTADTGKMLEIIKGFGNRLYFQPDTRISYCNSAYVMLGSIIEQLAGMRFGQLLKKEIFDTLEMDHSIAPDYMDQIDPEQVCGYMSQEAEEIVLKAASSYDAALTEAAAAPAAPGRPAAAPDAAASGPEGRAAENAASQTAMIGTIFRHVPYDMLEVGYADGNISTNVDDILKWHQYLFSESDDRIVPYSVRKEMWAPHVLKTGEKTNYGFGMMTGDFDDDHHTVSDRRELWHTGGTEGFISRISYFPDEKISAIMLTNWNGIARDELFREIVQTIFHRICDKKEVPRERDS